MGLRLYVTIAAGSLPGRFSLAEMGAVAIFFEDAAGGEDGDDRN